MPLHLNLTHEIRSHARQRQRDPLRLGLYGILGIILLCAGYYMLRASQVRTATERAAQLSRDWEKLETKQTAAAEQQTKLRAQLAERDHLLHRVEGRFYWAPVLGKIMESVSAEVQITRLDGSAPSVKEGTHQCNLSITGVAAGTEPRRTAEALRQRLRQKFASSFEEVTSTFKTLEDSSESVLVDGRPTPTAAFAIQLTFSSSLTSTGKPAVAAK